MMLEALVARRATVEIGIVVHLPRKVVERVDRGALPAWQRDETPVEVGRLAARHVLAVALQRAHVAGSVGVSSMPVTSRLRRNRDGVRFGAAHARRERRTR